MCGGEDRASPDLLLIVRGTGWTRGNNTRVHVRTHTHTHTHTQTLHLPSGRNAMDTSGEHGILGHFKVWVKDH